MEYARLGLALAVGAGGGLLAGPYVSYVVLRWIGWRVTLPILLGYVPSRAAVGAPPVRCRGCGGRLSVMVALPAMTRRGGDEGRLRYPSVGAPSSTARWASWRLGGYPAGGGGNDAQRRSWSSGWSWLWRRGRCRECGEAVAGWVAALELVTAALFGVVAWRLGATWSLLPVLAFCGALVAVSAVDLAFWRIPTRFVYVSGLLVAGLITLAALAYGEPGSLWGAVVGALAYSGVLVTMHLVSPRLLGFGDVRLGLLVGLVVGWVTWTPELPVLGPLAGVLQALLLASLAGTVVGLGLLVLRRRNQPYAFGPWISLGGVTTVLLAAPGAF